MVQFATGRFCNVHFIFFQIVSSNRFFKGFEIGYSIARQYRPCKYIILNSNKLR